MQGYLASCSRSTARAISPAAAIFAACGGANCGRSPISSVISRMLTGISTNTGQTRDAEGRLGQSAHKLVSVHLMQLVAMSGIGARTTRDDDHGHTVQIRFADAACGMSEACGRYHRQNADRVGQAADRIGHERYAAFVRNQHLRDPVGAVQRVVKLRRMHARNAEGEARPDLLQRVDREPGPCSLHIAPSSPSEKSFGRRSRPRRCGWTDAATEKGAFQRAQAMHAAAAESGSLAD